MASYVEKLLGIDFISNSVVGSVEERGISGGQKKRVSVAMEIMKEPALFFLDELTSGLDSATSLSLVHSLHELSKKGVNVIGTIHQPRYEILQQIDNVMLLAPGGTVAYLGPCSKIAAYFHSMNFTCPTLCNITDFMMDVLSGHVTEDNQNKVAPVVDVISKISCHWENQMSSRELPVISSTSCNHHPPPVPTSINVKLDKSLITFKSVFLR